MTHDLHLKYKDCFILAAAVLATVWHAQGQELRGTWIARDSVASKESLAQAMENLAANNFNAVYVNAWSRGYPLWPSQVFSNHTGVAIDPTFAGRDVMAEAIAEGHRHGLHVLAWMEYGLVGGYTGWYPGTGGRGVIFDVHPDWVARQRNGTEADANGFYWMVPTRPEVQQFLIDLSLELAGRYDLDGVELDRIRYSSLEYGYDDYTKALYASQHGGQNPPNNPSDTNWIRWRADQLNAFHKFTYDTLKSHYPQFNVCDAPSHYSTSTYTAYNNFCQDWVWWVNSNAVDNVQLQCYVSSSTTFDSYLNWVLGQVNDPSRVHPGLAIKPGGNWISYGELLNFIDVARDDGFSGQATWFYSDLATSNYLGNFSANRYASPSAPPYLSADWRDYRVVTPSSNTNDAVRTGSWEVSTEGGSGVLQAVDPFLSGDSRAAGEYTSGVDVRTQGAAAAGWVGTSGIDGYGVAHTGTTANFQSNATGENNSAVTYEQGGRLQWIGVGDFPFDRKITRQLNPVPSSTEWWVSVMVNRLGWSSSSANTFAVGGFTGASGSGLQVGYDDQLANDFTPDLVVRLGGANRVIETDAPANSSRLVLMQLLVNTTGNDTVSVWDNPSGVDPLGAADFVWNDVNVTDSLTPFTQSNYESPGQSGVAYFDEVRLATNLAGVIAAGPTTPGSSIFAASGTPAAVDYYFDVLLSGVYEVYAFQAAAPSLATNTPYVVFDADGGMKTNRVDQTDPANLRWLKLGDALLEAGRQRVLQVSNEGVAGGQFVSADEAMIVLNRRLSRQPTLSLLSGESAFDAGQFRFLVQGNVGQSIRLQGSSNGVDWVTAGTLTLTNGQGVFEDSTMPSLQQRLYRGRLMSKN